MARLPRWLEREDERARREALRWADWARSLDPEELFRYVTERTGGLGHGSEGFEVGKMALKGYLIAWPEEADGLVLEVGTGLGRTAWAVLEWGEPDALVTIEVDPRMLAIALHANPVPEFRDALRDERVKIVLGDAVTVVPRMPEGTFDHVVHDGGPCPSQNPRIFSHGFLRDLTRRLREGGTASVFAGRDPAWQDRLYRSLKEFFFDVKAEKFPDTPTVVLRCRGFRASP